MKIGLQKEIVENLKNLIVFASITESTKSEIEKKYRVRHSKHSY